MNQPSSAKNIILVVIVLAQFCGTSLWFAGNAVLPELITEFHLGKGALTNLTSAVQFGFISGTLCFAFLNIADRFSPSRVFLFSAFSGALFNSMIIIAPFGAASLWIYRFLTGFFLAGIYPVGMKIASDWFPGKLGRALGYLVGALVLGTAFPHVVRSYSSIGSWHTTMWIISGFALSGGLLVYFFIPDGPHRVRITSLKSTAIFDIFKVKDFRSASFGYFGHMWELYTFWAFVPLILETYAGQHKLYYSTSFWSFLIIGSGFFGCVLGGYLALIKGSARVAFLQLSISGLCCILSVYALNFTVPLFIIYLLTWGIAVVGDSPQFSTLVARTAPREYIGTALTITNCIGFAITIISIHITGYLHSKFPQPASLLILVIGPLFGLNALRNLLKKSP